MDKFEISREDYKKLIELNKSRGQCDMKMLKHSQWFVKKYGIEEVERVKQEVLKEMKERQRIKQNEHNKKYRENNREKVNEKQREYYNKNKNTINEKSKDYKSREYIKCECNSTIRKDQLSRHQKTKKHCEFIAKKD